VNQLVEAVSTQVLGKHTLEDNDSVVVNDGPELPCNIFDKLRKGQRFDAWTIMAAMQISDKPSFVRYGYSVPLDEIGKNRRMRAIAAPLAAWSRKVDDFRREAGTRPEDATRLVYFCPLNHKNNHFTLLEINEQKEMIRHYDSRASPGIIKQDSKPTRVERLVQVGSFLEDKEEAIPNVKIGSVWPFRICVQRSSKHSCTRYFCRHWAEA
jgi:hypothetical protein